MISNRSNSELALHTKSILSTLGHKVPLGHCYELLARLGGHKSYNSANSKGYSFAAALVRGYPPEVEAKIDDDTTYIVPVRVYFERISFVKHYEIKVSSLYEAIHVATLSAETTVSNKNLRGFFMQSPSVEKITVESDLIEVLKEGKTDDSALVTT